MSSQSSEPENPPSSPESKGQDADPTVSGRNKALVKGVAFGIGSAAIVAALLFAGRNKAKTDD
jgi:hypothetical protein